MEYIQFVIVGLTVGAIYALVALGFNLIVTSTGVFDFAQGEKVVLGGLIALSLIKLNLPLGLVVLLAVVIGFILGFLYERLVIAPTLKGGDIVTIIATLGVSLFFFHGHGIIWGQRGHPFPPFTTGQVRLAGATLIYQSFWVWGVVFVTLGAILLFFTRTREGKAMVASATNSTAAELVGINVRRMRVYAFSISFGLAILAGILIAPFTLAGGTIGFALTLKGFAGAIVGGIYSPVGVVVGALLVGVLEQVVGGATEYGFRDPSVYALLLLILLVRPKGIFSVREDRKA